MFPSHVTHAKSRENLIKPQKVANHLRKIPNLVFPSHVARASLRKKFETNTTPEYLWTTETLIIYVYSHGSMKRHIYLCEACILRLYRNGLKFFWQACIPKLRPQTRSEVFLIMFLLIYFSLCWIRQKRVNFILDPIDFIIHLHKILIPRAY